MSESPQPAPTEADPRLAQLARVRALRESETPAAPDEPAKPHLELVRSGSTPALPQRRPAAEAQASLETQAVEETTASVEGAVPVEEQKTETRPAFQLVDETNAKEHLETLRASQDAQTVAPVENETPSEYAGKRVDTTVAVDSESRAPEFGGEHRAGQHVAEVEATSDSETQTGGEHRAGSHSAETEVTSDSAAQTGGEHLYETELNAVPEQSVETPVAQPPEKHRKFGSILRFFRKK